MQCYCIHASASKTKLILLGIIFLRNCLNLLVQFFGVAPPHTHTMVCTVLTVCTVRKSNVCALRVNYFQNLLFIIIIMKTLQQGAVKDE